MSQEKASGPRQAGIRAEKGIDMTRYLSGPKGWTTGPYDLFRAGRSVWTWLKTVVQRMKNRRAVVQLLDWDERALRDIGLTRGDVRLSLALPYDEDPSTRLMFWALERRSARLRRARAFDDEPARQLRLVSDRSRSSMASTSR
jgi:uncharacterized protein YjiS (DUF1127 family)